MITWPNNIGSLFSHHYLGAISMGLLVYPPSAPTASNRVQKHRHSMTICLFSSVRYPGMRINTATPINPGIQTNRVHKTHQQFCIGPGKSLLVSSDDIIIFHAQTAFFIIMRFKNKSVCWQNIFI